MKKIGIYIHIPFCKVKCSYCHFFTFAGKLNKSPAFFRAMKEEIAGYKNTLADYQIDTIYIGGGTPSIIPANLIAELVDSIRNNFKLASDAEITIEANPESINLEKLDIYNESGINRISIGVQAWQQSILKYLNRLYTPDEFIAKYELVRNSGIKNINLDLIFGIPNQSIGQWEESIRKTINLNPQHISCYSLELDNNSHFGKLYSQGKFKAADSDVDRSMYMLTKKILTKSGYTQYETSNFCKPGFECRHNLNFWLGKEYIGIGAGAHSYFKDTRYHCLESIEEYTANTISGKKLITDEQHVSISDQMFDFILLRSRLPIGVSLDEFEQKFKVKLKAKFNGVLTKLKNEQLIRFENNHLHLTEKGHDLNNYVMTFFI